jgi:hypothetical protein
MRQARGNKKREVNIIHDAFTHVIQKTKGPRFHEDPLFI